MDWSQQMKPQRSVSSFFGCSNVLRKKLTCLACYPIDRLHPKIV
jgi:hypothetical protein